MATHPLPSRLTPFTETTQGTPPANAAAWAALTSRRHIAESIDVSSLRQSVIVDQRSQLYVYDSEVRILGIKGSVEVPWQVYLHGSGQSPADGATVTAWDLGSDLQHCWGGILLGTSDDLVVAGAHTTTAVELTDTLPRGTWLGFVDPATSLEYQRMVISNAAGGVGVVHQLHRALPFTPADESIAYGKTVIYLDEDVLEDSNGAGGPFTRSWLVEQGRQNSTSRETWQLMGCVSSLTGIELGRNDVPKLSFNTLVGSFLTPESSPVPTWASTPSGSAPRAIGPRTSVFLQTQGTTTNQTLQAQSFQITPGIARARFETVTEDQTNMPGTGRYGMTPGECRISAVVAPTADARLTEFANSTLLHCQFERNAPVGSAWSIYFPQVSHVEEPGRAAAGPLLGYQLDLQAHNYAAGTTDLSRSMIQIVL